MAILNGYSPIVEQVSIDEAYLDAAGCSRLYGPPTAMAHAIKDDILETVALTCSIGVAPLKFLAKIASDMRRPDGLTVIAQASVAGLDRRPARGKGAWCRKNAQQQLTQMGISTLGDVRKIRPSILVDRLGKFGYRPGRSGSRAGRFRRHPPFPTKSISTEKTLSADSRDREQLRQHLLAQSQEVEPPASQ